MRPFQVGKSSCAAFRVLTAAIAVFCALVCRPALGQQVQASVSMQSLITQPIDDGKLTTLTGNTHPLARPEFDLGTAEASLPMERMLLVLKRSPEQDAALRKLLDDQQDKHSPSYHRWLKPEEFGKQFGPTDTDLQMIVSWLQSHGFQVGSTRGRTMLEFSGTAGQVQEAFHTTIHKYLVNGEQHWANANDPMIPTALVPAVAGVHTLHDFRKAPQVRALPQRFEAKYAPGRPPKVTFGGNPPFHALGPADLAVIYNASAIESGGVTGKGVVIAVVGRSNLFYDQGGYAQPQDVLNFRGIFNICCGTVYDLINGSDPGDLGGIEEAEATLDASWAGALAPDADVEFVVTASTNTTDGVDLSELYIIENNVGSVMTESFGGCEEGATAVEAQGLAQLAEQAAAQGITYLVSSGDSGSAGCDAPNSTQEVYGLSVNVVASSPYTVAVGGTMFNENGRDSSYWSSTNNQANLASALSYIPEDVWNESCTPAACGQNAGLWSSGGGSSTIFSKPAWQAGFGPTDNSRDLPDVSLTAAGHDPYLLCLEGSCIPDVLGYIQFAAVSGTSASTPSFAGIMALVDQNMGGAQGQADYVLYRLAATENFAQCNGSSTSSPPAGSCTFNDITVGNNCVPGETGYPSSCTTYPSAVGYDLATGLGSVNVSNLITNWKAASFNATTTTLGLNPNPTNVPHGSAVTANVTVTSNSGTPTGDVSILTTTTPNTSVNLCAALNACTLQPGNGSASSVSVTTRLLPGGNYNLHAHYEGDGQFAPSDSAPSASVSVSAEPSNVALIVASGFDGSGNPIPFTSGPYGGLMYLRSDVSGQSGYGTPTGVVQFLDNGSVLAPPNAQVNPLGQLNGAGTAWTPNGVFTVGVGTRSIRAQYSGDASFQPSASSTTTVTITQASTTTSLQLTGSDQSGTDIVATVNSASRGNAPTGTVTFFSGGTALSGPVSVTSSTNSSGTAQAWAYISSPISGNPTLTAAYSGDTNYMSSTSAPLTASPDFVIVSNAGAGIVFNKTGASSGTTVTLQPVDAFSGTVTLSCSGFPSESTCNISPASVTLNSTNTLVNANVTVTTTAPTAHSATSLRPSMWIPAGTFVFGGVLMVLSSRRQPRAKHSSVLALLLMVSLFVLADCGGGGSGGSGGGGGGTPPPNPGTPPGAYTITVTGTGGTSSQEVHTTSFQLIVE